MSAINNSIDSTFQINKNSIPFTCQHPISKIIDDVRRIMKSLSLVEVESQHIEEEEYNFDHLNIPPNHPARGMHDTFYINTKQKMLLRSHTSNTQIRILESCLYNIPFGIFTIGRVYRRDHDSTHLPMFHQIEVLIVDDSISIANLKWTVKRILKALFVDWLPEFRFRSSYFPFTEPSIEVDMMNNQGNWCEVLGCGMVRSNILQRYGYHTRGLAIGMGLERLCMLKYGIHNISDLYNNKHDFLSTWT